MAKHTPSDPVHGVTVADERVKPFMVIDHHWFLDEVRNVGAVAFCVYLYFYVASGGRDVHINPLHTWAVTITEIAELLHITPDDVRCSLTILRDKGFLEIVEDTPDQSLRLLTHGGLN